MSEFIEGVYCVISAVQANADKLNDLDKYAGDGDLGVSMNIACRALIADLPKYGESSPSEILLACGEIIGREAPSTSGTLLASALSDAGRTAAEGLFRDALTIARLLNAIAECVRSLGGAEVGAKTMLDALVPAAESASKVAKANGTFEAALIAASQAAKNGCKATAGMEPKFGRASWLRDRSRGHVDGGAQLISIALEAIAQYAGAG